MTTGHVETWKHGVDAGLKNGLWGWNRQFRTTKQEHKQRKLHGEPLIHPKVIWTPPLPAWKDIVLPFLPWIRLAGKQGGHKDPSTSSTTGETDFTHLFYLSAFCILKGEEYQQWIYRQRRRAWCKRCLNHETISCGNHAGWIESCCCTHVAFSAVSWTRLSTGIRRW